MPGLEAELWVVPIPAPLSEAEVTACLAILSDAERAGAVRFHHRRRRDQALVARALVRRALSHRLGGAPERWAFETAPNGRPRLAEAGGPDFNLAHADDCVVLAVSPRGRIGVDVEPVARAAEIRTISARFLARAEIDALAALDPGTRDRRLVELWTLKEAWAKLSGSGLSTDFRTLAFCRTPDGYRLSAEPEVRFETFAVDPAHIVALALEDPGVGVARNDGTQLLFG